ncbi:hypothetical protein [Nocardioides endophyticus]|uniref:PaaD-like zinc ribbon domain-containing protein n=1 Tax=Nocardioides endophyticus TaxID=1353775 RepID=UPI003CD0A3EA
MYGDDLDFAAVTCPACGSGETEVESLTGSSASEVLFFCRSCRSCFNWIKWQHKLPPFGVDPRGSSSRSSHG